MALEVLLREKETHLKFCDGSFFLYALVKYTGINLSRGSA
jgi:hypothetical protein